MTSASVKTEKSPRAMAAALSLALSGLRSIALVGLSAGRLWPAPRTPGWSASVLISSSTPSFCRGCASSTESGSSAGPVGRSAGLGGVIRRILPGPPAVTTGLEALETLTGWPNIGRLLRECYPQRGRTRWAERPMPVMAWAHNSAVECHLHTVEVAGSNPAAPTIAGILHSCQLSGLHHGRVISPGYLNGIASSFFRSYTGLRCEIPQWLK